MRFMFTPGMGASSMWQLVHTLARRASAPPPAAPAPTADSLGSTRLPPGGLPTPLFA